LKYPGTKWLMGRSELKVLKETTLQSFFEVCRIQGLKADIHYRLTSAQDKENPNCIVFPNRSVIMMRDLFAYPSDPNFDSLGSLEITGAFIDECNQLVEKAKNIVKSRIRYRLDENGLIPKMLLTCNPAKNWVYHVFYKPSREGTLVDKRKFIPALVGDNPDISKHYKSNLEGLDLASKERLLYGNWEYDDDKATLIQYEKILDCFTNEFVSGGTKYITADIARFGSDSTLIAVWDGFRCKMYQYNQQSLTQTSEVIRELGRKYNVPISNIIADEDGVGGGVVDILRCKGFVNNSSALPNPDAPYNEKGERPKENYANLKSQCYFRLAERINKGEVFIDCQDIEMKGKIIQELEQVKQHNMDKDGKRQVLPKDKVKEIIGRSPDFADALMMRMYFDLKPKQELIWA
jgi:phage terminase large subunit